MEGVLSEGVLSEGVLSEGFCPRGFCPEGVLSAHRYMCILWFVRFAEEAYSRRNARLANNERKCLSLELNVDCHNVGRTINICKVELQSCQVELSVVREISLLQYVKRGRNICKTRSALPRLRSNREC